MCNREANPPPGELAVPEAARGVVIFAHGSGSSRFSVRNRYVAGQLRGEGLGTLLLDLLTGAEEEQPGCRFDLDLLAGRLRQATEWVRGQWLTQALPVAYFGASTGAAAALLAAAEPDSAVYAVVSRGGRPDLVGNTLGLVRAPTLLLVGSRDEAVLAGNRRALRKLNAQSTLEIVEGARHLFPEPGALEEVARLAGAWLVAHLPAGARGGARREGTGPQEGGCEATGLGSVTLGWRRGRGVR
ncbi:MAG: dienelactone hydrolase family protein [Acidobacteriota bacterium]